MGYGEYDSKYIKNTNNINLQVDQQYKKDMVRDLTSN